jgi:hypothetical protein
MATIREIIAKLSLDPTEFSKGLDQSTKKVQDFGKRMESVGKTLSLSLTAPLTAFAALSVKAFDTQIQAENRLRAAIQASGNAVDENFDKYAAFASELQRVSTVGDETTLALLATAESMGISGGNAMRAAKNAVSLEKALGISAQSAIRMTTALEQGDAAMLTRYIPALRGVESESEKVRIAQEELAKMFGQVTAEAETGLGPLKQLQNTFGDFMEQIGEVVLEALQPLFRWLQKGVDALMKIDKSTLKWIVAIGAAVAAVGPLLMALGFLATTIIPALVAGFAAIFSPVALVIAGIAALAAAVIYVMDNWEALKERISDIGWWRNAIIGMVQFIAKYNPTALLLKGINEVIKFFGGDPIPDPFEGISKVLGKLKADTKEYKHEFGSFADAVKNAGKSAINALMGMGEAAEKAEPDVDILIGKAGTAGGTGLRGVVNVTKAASQGLVSMGSTLTALTTPIELVKVNMDDLNGTTRYAAQMQEFFANILFNVEGALTGIFETMLNGGNAFEFIGRMLKRLVAQLAAAAAMAAILNALIPGGGAIGGGAKALTGGTQGFANIFKQFMGMGIPKMARGGMVTGLTTAILGDNPSGKEAVIPFERMGEFLNMAGVGQSGTVQVQGILRGEDIFLSSERYLNNQNRRLGI